VLSIYKFNWKWRNRSVMRIWYFAQPIMQHMHYNNYIVLRLKYLDTMPFIMVTIAKITFPGIFVLVTVSTLGK